MTLPPVAPRVPAHIDSDGLVATGVTCLHCGYNLRGLAIAGTCPECGMTIRTSLRGDRLGDAPEPWRRQLTRGVRLARLGTMLTPIVIGLPIATAGLWMLTTPEPNRDEPAGDERYRWSARTLLLAGTTVLVALAAAAVAALARDPRGALSGRWDYADVVLIAGCGLFVMGFLATTVYFEALALRIPDAGLAREVRRGRTRWYAGLGALVLVALATRVADFAYLRMDLYSPYAAGVFALIVAAILVALWGVTLRMLGAVARALPV